MLQQQGKHDATCSLQTSVYRYIGGVLRVDAVAPPQRVNQTAQKRHCSHPRRRQPYARAGSC